MSQMLYYAPGACSLACHIALEEAGADFGAHRLDFAKGEQRSSEYLRINPHGRVPALQVGERVLTEGPAILGYIARSHPGAGLLPADEFDAAGVASFIAWCSGTVHVTFAHVFRAERYASGDAALASVRETALAALPGYFADVNERFEAREWAAGDAFGIGDGYPFVFWRWARRLKLEMGAYPHWQQHTWRMLDRPAVRRAVDREGLAAGDWIETR
jgi:glutathione S-transferase